MRRKRLLRLRDRIFMGSTPICRVRQWPNGKGMVAPFPLRLQALYVCSFLSRGVFYNVICSVLVLWNGEI